METKNQAPEIVALGALYHGDDPNYFEQCLESIRLQSLQLPITIVVDGPIGLDLEKVIIKYEDLNIRYIRKAENEGLASALQAGLLALKDKYEYVLRFDADDINCIDRFKMQCEFVTRFSPDLASAQMREIDSSGQAFSSRLVPTEPHRIQRWMPFRNPISHPACVIRIEKALAVGGYWDMPFFEDWCLWERIMSAGGRVLNSGEYMVDFRATDDMVARRFGFRYLRHEAHFYLWRIKNREFPIPILLLAWVFRVGTRSLGFGVYKLIFYLVRK